MTLAPSSPRLPSPPPPPEIQLTPQDQSPGAQSVGPGSPAPVELQAMRENARRRVHPGTRAADMAAGPPLISLLEVNSAFQLQEHLAALHYSLTDQGRQPLSRSSVLQIARPPQLVDRQLWLYELCRFLIAECNKLIVGFLFDTPPCSATTCPEMRASEWQFLCAVHEQPKSCCAIDYCCHTLDWAANVVTDHRMFPSRFVTPPADAKGGPVGPGGNGGGLGGSSASHKSLVNIFRRLHRIFAHSWFQHRSVFWSIESQTGLYLFFKVVCDMYDLLPGENYKLPPEAEGLEGATPVQGTASDAEKSLASAMAAGKPAAPVPPKRAGADDDAFQPNAVGRTNTRRHIRSNPSTGSAVTTVIEADEEDAASITNRLQEVRITDQPVPAEEEEEEEEEDSEIEVPVIVERDDTLDDSPRDAPAAAAASLREELPVDPAPEGPTAAAAAAAEEETDTTVMPGEESAPEGVLLGQDSAGVAAPEPPSHAPPKDDEGEKEQQPGNVMGSDAPAAELATGASDAPQKEEEEPARPSTTSTQDFAIASSSSESEPPAPDSNDQDSPQKEAVESTVEGQEAKKDKAGTL